MRRIETTDRQLYKRLEELREKMSNMAVVRPEDWTPADRKEFLDCVSEIIRMEREVSAREGIIEALKDEELPIQGPTGSTASSEHEEA